MTKEYVVPGQRVGNASEYTAGKGTYIATEKDNAICASIAGVKVLLENNVITIERRQRGKIAPIASDLILRLDDHVIGKVVKLSPWQVMIDIVSVNGHVLQETFSGTLRKEDVRSMDVDSLVLDQMFTVGDIVQAAVLSFGDSRSYYLSTAKPGLGRVQIH